MRILTVLLNFVRKPISMFIVVTVLIAQSRLWRGMGGVGYNSVDTPSYSNLTNTAVICCIVSNEEYYLDEWLDYNLGIGFSHIYVYDNTDQFDLGHGWLDRRVARLGDRVTIQHYPGEGKQWTAYRDCGASVLSDGHRWIFYTDADEFLVLKKHANVSSFLLEYDTMRMALSINWQVHSWNYEMQFRPQPVTKRFNGKMIWSNINHHVKTISNVDKIDLTARQHPHYATLKKGNYAIDTNGDKVADKWMNPRYPSDVALIYHHNVKSWKECIGKRTRGRATMTGTDLADSNAQLISGARRGGELHNTSEIDTSAWDTLKRANPKYQFFDSELVVASKNKDITIGICCHVQDQEAYIDEWIDYHLALGVSNIYIYDGSDDFWMRQWGERRNETWLSLEHFPAETNHTKLDEEKAMAYAKCVNNHGKKHIALALLDVNDFFVLQEASVEPLVQLLLNQSGACAAIPIEKKLFGHNGQFVYEPLPVTKRFTLQINTTSRNPSTLLLKTNATAITSGALQTLSEDFIQYSKSGTFTSTTCIAADTIAPGHISVHHYLRSIKECNKEKENKVLCNTKGDIEDKTAWEQMQSVLPWYANFNGMISYANQARLSTNV